MASGNQGTPCQRKTPPRRAKRLQRTTRIRLKTVTRLRSHTAQQQIVLLPARPHDKRDADAAPPALSSPPRQPPLPHGRLMPPRHRHRPATDRGHGPTALWPGGARGCRDGDGLLPAASHFRPAARELAAEPVVARARAPVRSASGTGERGGFCADQVTAAVLLLLLPGGGRGEDGDGGGGR